MHLRPRSSHMHVQSLTENDGRVISSVLHVISVAVLQSLNAHVFETTN